ncbi:MAG: hypothetical protein ACI8PT_004314, partial [Gammaproteobacteria bacterium]
RNAKIDYEQRRHNHHNLVGLEKRCQVVDHHGEIFSSIVITAFVVLFGIGAK